MKQENEQLVKVRHSLAHLLVAAILELYPGSENAIGPAIENGFYQDFEIAGKISDEDLPKIEKKMKEILKTWKSFDGRKASLDEAEKEFVWNKYKLEMARDLAQKGQQLTIYTSGKLVDLCRGGHVNNPVREINPDAFKLSHVAGAYWRGDEKNIMLTRIYGLAFDTKKELDEYIERQEEAKKRDHRKLGAQLNLFTFSETIGKGLPLWTEKGATMRREIERFTIDEEIKRGYLHVCTPDIAKIALYEKSGHYPYYKDSMYAPITIDDEQFMLRPMTCPHHFELYLSKPKSYRDLPMRIAEVAKLYRYEQSGELTGLIRVRSFSLADSHIVCADPKQAKEEINGVLDLIDYMNGIFKLEIGKDYWYRLSLGDRKNEEKYYKDDKAWDEAEKILREVLAERKTEFIEAEDEAAFYGPKIDIQMKNFAGKEDTAFTVQYDFVMPKRFNLKYVDRDGKEKQPIVIHRSSIGCIERTIAFLIEHYAGAFPLWLSPVQVKVLPVSEKHISYAKEVVAKLKEDNIRVEIDESNQSLAKKIRGAKMEKIPYLAVIGEKEMENSKITIESRGEGNVGSFNVDDIAKRMLKEIKEKK
jgi:threonyl-tRNA synthetase